MLREKDVFDVSEVETAIVEANGSLSLLKIPGKQLVLQEDIHITNAVSSMALPVIVEGKVDKRVLDRLTSTLAGFKIN